MCLQRLTRWTRRDAVLVQTGLDRYEGKRLIAEGLRETPNGGSVKVVEEEAPARGVGRLHKGQSIRLCKTISQGQSFETSPYL